MAAWTANLAVAAAVVLTGVSLLLAAVGFLSYARLRHARLLWVGLAFVGFAAEGAALAWWTFGQRAELAAGGGESTVALLLLNLATVTCLYLAVLKR